MSTFRLAHPRLAISLGLIFAASAITTAVPSAMADQICKAKNGVLRLRPACKGREVALPIEISADGKTVLVTGANLQVVSGAGGTHFPLNGLGNVIIGYNGAEDLGDRQRTGSHNLVIGDEHTYTSYGSIVAGYGNFSMAPSSAILAGENNRTLGPQSRSSRAAPT
ncbi:MAG TPA: hypothetical protein VIS07_07775 [Candidatus Binatia bacterium]